MECFICCHQDILIKNTKHLLQSWCIYLLCPSQSNCADDRSWGYSHCCRWQSSFIKRSHKRGCVDTGSTSTHITPGTLGLIYLGVSCRALPLRAGKPYTHTHVVDQSINLSFSLLFTASPLCCVFLFMASVLLDPQGHLSCSLTPLFLCLHPCLPLLLFSFLSVYKIKPLNLLVFPLHPHFVSSPLPLSLSICSFFPFRLKVGHSATSSYSSCQAWHPHIHTYRLATTHSPHTLSILHPSFLHLTFPGGGARCRGLGSQSDTALFCSRSASIEGLWVNWAQLCWGKKG